MQDAIDILLSLQNTDGGFASYELIRGTKYLELINPAEVFVGLTSCFYVRKTDVNSFNVSWNSAQGNIMIEYNYPECSTASLTALSVFHNLHPSYRSAEVERTIKRAIGYIHASQRPEGGWFGSWGVCFTYATMFALESLALNGESYETSSRVRRACDFLLDKQMADGGWGESWKACEVGHWVDHERSQVINTAWAVMALLIAECPDHEAIKRGCRLLMSRQERTGEWKLEAIVGLQRSSERRPSVVNWIRSPSNNASCVPIAVRHLQSVLCHRLSQLQDDLCLLGSRPGSEEARLVKSIEQMPNRLSDLVRAMWPDSYVPRVRSKDDRKHAGEGEGAGLRIITFAQQYLLYVQRHLVRVRKDWMLRNRRRQSRQRFEILEPAEYDGFRRLLNLACEEDLVKHGVDLVEIEEQVC